MSWHHGGCDYTRLRLQIKQLLKPVVDTVGAPYAAWVNKRLASVGLRYDDLYDPLKDEVRIRHVACTSATRMYPCGLQPSRWAWSCLAGGVHGPAWHHVCIMDPWRTDLTTHTGAHSQSHATVFLACMTQDVAEALRRLPPDVVMARNSRLRRAIDLDCKHDHLHGELLAKQTPAEHYLQVSRLCSGDVCADSAQGICAAGFVVARMLLNTESCVMFPHIEVFACRQTEWQCVPGQTALHTLCGQCSAFHMYTKQHCQCHIAI